MTIPLSTRQHWMSEVLGNVNARAVYIAPGLTSTEIWAVAMTASGLSGAELAERVARHFRLRVADLESADFRILRLIPEKTARRYVVLPLSEDDKHIYVATADYNDLEMAQAVTFASGRTPVFLIAPPKAILEKLELGYSPELRGPTGSELQQFAAPGVKRSILSAGLIRMGAGETSIEELGRILGDTSEAVATVAASDQTRILIVDDDSINRQLARSILEKQGYLVSEAADGVAAIDLVSQSPLFNLIILDLSMPRLGGREVLAKLKGSVATVGIPVIVLTASADETVEAEVMEEGADDYIRKPLEPVRFTARIRAALRRAAG